MSTARMVVPAISAQGEASEQRSLLLVLSHLRWDFVFQRPQHLMTRAGRSWPVLFVEEPLVKAGLNEARLDERVVAPGVTVAVPILPEGLSREAVIRTQRVLLDAALARRRPARLYAWFYTPMALHFAGHLAPDAIIYDCMDELSAFRGAPPELTQFERRLMSRSDLVFTGGRSLYEGKRNLHENVHAFPSSIDQAHFRPARAALPDPQDQARLARPRVGYFGVVDERMDLDLVDRVAAARPDWSVVMIGPVVKIDPATLPRRANIHWLGQKSYAELPSYLSNWDVGFMPFALNEATRFISPTKTPEFLAAGVPVVSTPIADVINPWGTKGLVSIAYDAEQAVTMIEASMRRNARWRAKVDRHLANMSWDLTWGQMQRLIEQAGAATQSDRDTLVARSTGKEALAHA